MCQSVNLNFNKKTQMTIKVTDKKYQIIHLSHFILNMLITSLSHNVYQNSKYSYIALYGLYYTRIKFVKRRKGYEGNKQIQMIHKNA